MSSKTRNTSSPQPANGSKLPRFLQKQGRDRSRSVADPTASVSSVASSSSSPPSTPSKKPKGTPTSPELEGETPVIVEPVAIPRPRTRSERPVSDSGFYQPSASGARIADLPTRLSGWFSHTFSTSSTDLSLPNLLAQSPQTSARKGSSLLTAAKHGRGHLDKAMRYLLDSDATPDRCPDPIWLLGMSHSGFDPAPLPLPVSTPASPSKRTSNDLRSSQSTPPSSFRPYPENIALSGSQSSLNSSQSGKNPATNWPPVFYDDFTSRIWLTYRSNFSPIRDTNLACLPTDVAEGTVMSSSPQSKKWFGLAEKGWTSDAGWGCMLRTGQSLLANTLLHLHLGRDWRRPPYPVHTADYATYVRILTWFFDSPSPLCPFSVHRMALAGKDLGKDVGQWFGPSTAAGAIRTLVHAYPEAGLGVSVASDSVIYQTDVFAASHGAIGSPKRHAKSSWGSRGVLVLIGVRLGLEGVNPIYYDTIKELYTFPQSVGIAGGRPSSSYYFVGSQTDNLFYLDPHHARPAIPLRTPPGEDHTPDSSTESAAGSISRRRSANHSRSPTSPRSANRRLTMPTSSNSSASSHSRWQTDVMDSRELGTSGFSSPHEELEPTLEHYVTSYSVTELKTFHCDRVRKMPLSGLDPSMLIGFFCRDEADWKDFRQRVVDLGKNHKTIFSVQDEPPTWPSSDSDSNLGLESISDPDMDMEDDEDEFSFEGDVDVEHTESGSDSPDTSISVRNGNEGRGKSSEVDTEEDPIGPITPHAGTFAERGVDLGGRAFEDEEVDELGDDEDWVDPVEPTPPKSKSKSKSKSREGGKKKKEKKGSSKEVPIIDTPLASQHFPFPSSTNDSGDADQSASSPGKRVPQMRTTKARDGGRTQSGGVRGIFPTDDGDDF